MPVAYVDSNENTKDDNSYTIDMLLSEMTGIEAIPYQFMDSVDERIRRSQSTSQSAKTKIGRKYGEKIVGRMPLLFLTPCEPYFLNSSRDDQKVMFGALLSNQNSTEFAGISDLLSDKANGARYYTSQYATADYYKYLNFMLNSVADYLGMHDEPITFNGKDYKLGEVPWQDELSPNFSNYFYNKTFGENSLFFYCDSMDSVSESFTNDTTQSSLASQVNGYSDSVKEIQFLLGGQNGGLVSDALTSIQGMLDPSNDEGILASLGGWIANTLTDITTGSNSWLSKMTENGSFGAVAAGGKIIFPEIWSDSQYSKSYSLDIKLRSPDHDSLSIFMNIIKPYCKLLALTMPRAFKNLDGEVDPNGYGSPFLVKASCKGLFNIDMGLITGLSVTKGAACAWNDDGLPTQIDITLDIKDLYNTLAMSGYPNLSMNAFSTFDELMNTTRNVAYMDFLANMAGLNVAEMAPFRSLRSKYYSLKSMVNQIPSTIGARFDQSIANLIGKIKWFS